MRVEAMFIADVDSVREMLRVYALGLPWVQAKRDQRIDVTVVFGSYGELTFTDDGARWSDV